MFNTRLSFFRGDGMMGRLGRLVCSLNRRGSRRGLSPGQPET
jgi:hypothetical protein